MPKAKELLWDAERLVLFANAADRRAVEEFRSNHEHFFPPSFWAMSDLPVPGELLFEVDSSKLFSSLGADPSGESEPAESVPYWKKVPYWWMLQQALRRSWELSFPLNWCVMLISAAHDQNPTPFRVWPFQRAVMFLGVEPWRARFCGVCGNRFVADKPARRFCSSACATRARQGTRAASWKRHGEEWRTRYQKRKPRQKPSRRAKR